MKLSSKIFIISMLMITGAIAVTSTFSLYTIKQNYVMVAFNNLEARMKNVQQVTDVVHETAKGATDTAAASSQLSAQAHQLQKLVGKFRLA